MVFLLEFILWKYTGKEENINVAHSEKFSIYELIIYLLYIFNFGLSVSWIYSMLSEKKQEKFM